MFAPAKRAEVELRDANLVGNSAWGKFQDKCEDAKDKVTLRVWGWSTVAAILGLIVAVLMIAAIVTSFFVAVVRAWSWIGSFIWSIFGLVFLILALVWLFGSPSVSVDPYSAGISIGPFVLLVASLIILPAGVMDGILGLRGLLARIKARRAALA